MYTLRLLRTASIEQSQGLVVAGRAAQGRRLALLALLALARGRALSRDKLVAVLWPEASHDRARPQLSDTVYVLRHALGDDVVRSAGDGLVLNPQMVTSDVALFEQMVEQGRLEDAVALYRGPLLDGFHISDSVEFETWLDGERAELDRRYAATLDALAEAAQARGDVDAAVGWWRRRAVHEPHNGRVALRLMRARDAAGDRAGALQHARIHATLLREDFDAHPDAELVAFTEQLRREPAPAPSSKPSPPSSSHPTTTPAATLLTVSAAESTVEPPQPSSAAAQSTVEPPQPLAPSAPRGARRHSAPVVLALALALTLGVAYDLSRSDPPAPARSVGVLPFINMSPDPANTYFSDGVSEQIILALSRIDGLRVAARTSSFALRNRELDVRAIADTLDVHAVLEGSVLVQGATARHRAAHRCTHRLPHLVGAVRRRAARCIGAPGQRRARHRQRAPPSPRRHRYGTRPRTCSLPGSVRPLSARTVSAERSVGGCAHAGGGVLRPRHRAGTTVRAGVGREGQRHRTAGILPLREPRLRRRAAAHTLRARARAGSGERRGARVARRAAAVLRMGLAWCACRTAARHRAEPERCACVAPSRKLSQRDGRDAGCDRRARDGCAARSAERPHARRAVARLPGRRRIRSRPRAGAPSGAARPAPSAAARQRTQPSGRSRRGAAAAGTRARGRGGIRPRCDTARRHTSRASDDT